MSFNTATQTTAALLGRASDIICGIPVPLAGVEVQLGFPSPAEDFLDDAVDLHQLLVRNPLATYLYRSAGTSMWKAGILDGDILAVDRSVRPVDGDLVLATWEGNQPTCKILELRADCIVLKSASDEFDPIVIEQGCEVEIFAITGVARQIRRGRGRFGGRNAT